MKQWVELPKEKKKNDFEFTVIVTPDKKTSIEYKTGKFVNVQNFEINIKATVDTTTLNLNSGRYLGKEIAYGSANNIFQQSSNKNDKVLVTLITKEGQIDAGSMMIPKFQGKEKNVFPLKIVPMFPVK
jgi:hypothetical protein